MPLVRFFVAAYDLTSKYARPAVASIIILLIRIIWGLQFIQTGWGKLTHIDKPIAFFHDLGIPFPTANAYLVGFTELTGGILLLIGFGARWAAFALTVTLTVAYLTASHDAVVKLFHEGDPTDFMSATPFWFIVTTLIVLAFGAKWFSIDAIIKCVRCHMSKKTPRPETPIAAHSQQA